MLIRVHGLREFRFNSGLHHKVDALVTRLLHFIWLANSRSSFDTVLFKGNETVHVHAFIIDQAGWCSLGYFLLQLYLTVVDLNQHCELDDGGNLLQRWRVLRQRSQGEYCIGLNFLFARMPVCDCDDSHRRVA